MDTTTRPTAVPEALSEWQPACDMFGAYAPPCENAADYGLVTHGGCSVRLTCAPCYRRFLAIFVDWLGERPQSNITVCDACHAPIDNLWGALHLEPM